MTDQTLNGRNVRKSDAIIDTAALLTFIAVAIILLPDGDNTIVFAVYLTAYAAVLVPTIRTCADELEAVGWFR